MRHTVARRLAAQGCKAGLLMALGLPSAFAEGWLPDKFKDPATGELDLSDWLLEQKGFLPVPIIITEPAVGYGGGIAPVFFFDSIKNSAEKARETGHYTPPNIVALAAFGTENGTWGAGGGGMFTFREDRYRWRGGVARANVNLDFYGAGGLIGPLAYNLDGWMSVQHGMMRLGESNAWAVLRWNYFSLENKFDLPGQSGQFVDTTRTNKASGLGVSLEYDSRDNLFTPNTGWTGSLDLTFYDPDIGSDTRFQSYRAHVFSYWKVSPVLVLGLRADGRAAEGDVPFYMLPFVDLRGVPAMRLQDTRTAVLETELRWNLDHRWALVGFLGGGKAWGTREDFSDGASTVSKGAGFRYLIASKLGIYMGMDMAWSTQDKAWYIQVGNAWR